MDSDCVPNCCRICSDCNRADSFARSVSTSAPRPAFRLSILPLFCAIVPSRNLRSAPVRLSWFPSAVCAVTRAVAPVVPVSAAEADDWSAPAAMVPNVSTPAAVRVNVEPISVANVLASPLLSALLILDVAPISLLMTDLSVDATAPDAEPTSV